MASFVLQEAQQRARVDGHGTARHTVIGEGNSRRLLLPTGGEDERRTVAEDPSAAEPAAAVASGASATPVPTLAYGVKCLRNALLLCDTQRAASAPVDYSALVAAHAQGTLTLSEESALQLFAVKWLALLQLSWAALMQEDYSQALAWAQQLLQSTECRSNLKVYAQLYCCDALCHLSRIEEAEQHLVEAVQLGDPLAGTATASGGSDHDASAAEGDIDSVRNPYCAMSPALESSGGGPAGSPASRGVLYTNLAAVYILQGNLKQALTCVRQALSAHPNNRHALLCLVYLELRNGNTKVALDILKRQRLPAPVD